MWCWKLLIFLKFLISNDEDKDEKKTDTSFNPGRSLNEDAVVNEYWSSEPTPVDDKMKKHGLRNITSEMARDYRIGTLEKKVV